MRSIILSEVNEILKAGHSLSEIGVNNWALPYDKALNALPQFEKWGIPVLGGDVCESIDGIFQYTCDNWYCDQEDTESNSDFVIRSVEKAKTFILNFKTEYADRTSFALVLDTSLIH